MKYIIIMSIICGMTFSVDYSFGQNPLSKNISNNATKNPYNAIRIDDNGYFFVHKNMAASNQYANCLIETNAPTQLYPFFAEIIYKYYGIGTHFYNNLFTENRTYSEKEIDAILAKYNIDLFIKIGFEQDVYNRGSKSSGTGFDFGQMFPELSSGISINESKAKALRGKVVNLYIDFYDKQLIDEPIIKVISLGFSKKESEYAIAKQMYKKAIWAIMYKKLITKQPKGKYKEEAEFIDNETKSEEGNK